MPEGGSDLFTGPRPVGIKLDRDSTSMRTGTAPTAQPGATASGRPRVGTGGGIGVGGAADRVDGSAGGDEGAGGNDEASLMRRSSSRRSGGGGMRGDAEQDCSMMMMRRAMMMRQQLQQLQQPARYRTRLLI